MRNFIRRGLLSATFLSMVMFFFYACRKDFGKGDQRTAISEAKAYYATLINSEKSLLQMPFDQLKKNANLRRFARIGKMGNKLQWDKAMDYYRGDIGYTIVPVDEDVHHLHNPARESVRYLLFSKKDGENMIMNIIELYNEKNQTLGNALNNSLRICAENMLFGEKKPVQQISASVIFYDRYYYNSSSFTIKNGNWNRAKIIVENTNKQFSRIVPQTLSAGGRSGGNDVLKRGLSTVSPMSGCSVCTTYYLVGIWYDTSTGEIVDTEILDSWDECVDPNYTPEGSAPGTTVTSSNNQADYNKNVINNLNNPCLAAQLSAMANSLANFVATAQNNENIYMPVNINFADVTDLPDETHGQTINLYTDNNGITNIDIVLNKNTLPGTSIEYFSRTILHEALHGALLLNGTAWNGVLQHNEIANYYLNLMANTMMSLFPGMSSTDAAALAWEGLKATTAWDNLSGSQQDAINDIITNYRNRSSGTSC